MAKAVYNEEMHRFDIQLENDDERALEPLGLLPEHLTERLRKNALKTAEAINKWVEAHPLPPPEQ